MGVFYKRRVLTIFYSQLLYSIRLYACGRTAKFVRTELQSPPFPPPRYSQVKTVYTGIYRTGMSAHPGGRHPSYLFWPKKGEEKGGKGGGRKKEEGKRERNLSHTSHYNKQIKTNEYFNKIFISVWDFYYFY